MGWVDDVLCNSKLEMVFGQKMLRILLRHLFLKTFSLWLMVFSIFQDSAPEKRVLRMLVLVLMFFALHGFLSAAKAWLAFEILALISSSASLLLLILEPRKVKCSTWISSGLHGQRGMTRSPTSKCTDADEHQGKCSRTRWIKDQCQEDQASRDQQQVRCSCDHQGRWIQEVWSKWRLGTMQQNRFWYVKKAENKSLDQKKTELWVIIAFSVVNPYPVNSLYPQNISL